MMWRAGRKFMRVLSAVMMLSKQVFRRVSTYLVKEIRSLGLNVELDERLMISAGLTALLECNEFTRVDLSTHILRRKVMNQEVMNIFNPAQEGPTFDRIRISLASS